MARVTPSQDSNFSFLQSVRVHWLTKAVETLKVCSRGGSGNDSPQCWFPNTCQCDQGGSRRKGGFLWEPPLTVRRPEPGYAQGSLLETLGGEAAPLCHSFLWATWASVAIPGGLPSLPPRATEPRHTTVTMTFALLGTHPKPQHIRGHDPQTSDKASEWIHPDLSPRFKKPWPLRWVDPAPPIVARRSVFCYLASRTSSNRLGII